MRRERGAGRVRLATLAVLAVLLAPAAAAQYGNSLESFALRPLPPATLRPGDAVSLPVEAAHRCPATGTVRFFAGAANGLEADIADAAWGPCGSDDYARASTTLRVRALPNATYGANGVAVGAFWSGRTVDTALKVTVPYVGRADLAGPSEAALLPGRPTALQLEIRVAANGDSRVHLGHDAPDGWTVSGPASVEVRGGGPVTWTARVTPPERAAGDVRISFTAVPRPLVPTGEEGQADTHRWTARLPGATATEAPARPPPESAPATGGGGDAGAPPPAPVADEGALPPWAIGALVLLLGLAALAWARRG